MSITAYLMNADANLDIDPDPDADQLPDGCIDSFQVDTPQTMFIYQANGEAEERFFRLVEFHEDDPCAIYVEFEPLRFYGDLV